MITAQHKKEHYKEQNLSSSWYNTETQNIYVTEALRITELGMQLWAIVFVQYNGESLGSVRKNTGWGVKVILHRTLF